jgi:hypothetical protein
MTHTKEPWQVNFSDSTQICDCDGESRGCAPIAVMADGDDDAEANARRIVACVNACAGLGTEALDSRFGIAREMWEVADDRLARIHMVVRQRDKLLEASKTALDWITAQNGYPAAVSDRLYEAIAEIENS